MEVKVRKQNRNKKVDKRLSMSRHHLKNKVNGGGSQEWNIAVFHIERHQYWHRVFGNLDLTQVIDLLTRYKEIKDYQKFKSDKA